MQMFNDSIMEITLWEIDCVGARAHKGELLDQIKTLDIIADNVGLWVDEWMQIYSLEAANLKFLLLCFEDMSSLKINFDKSEVIAMGYSESKKRRIANNLNCRLGTFPIEYFGMPLSDSKVPMSTFDPLVGQVRTRVEPWCEGLHGVFDKDLARLFWKAVNGR
ncbi:Peptide transporter PTR2 [Hordeum vulgare]|nr:Peptide transporter PTR2 [Hordeum vulgare]